MFPAAGVVIKPSAGSMVVWKDVDQEGLNDYRTLHGACPVVVGEKWSKDWMNHRNILNKLVCSLYQEL